MRIGYRPRGSSWGISMGPLGWLIYLMFVAPMMVIVLMVQGLALALKGLWWLYLAIRLAWETRQLNKLREQKGLPTV